MYGLVPHLHVGTPVGSRMPGTSQNESRTLDSLLPHLLDFQGYNVDGAWIRLDVF